MEARRLGKKTRDLLLLYRRPPRLPGRIIGENGLGDEGIEGEARPGHARMKFLPQRFGRAVGNGGVASLPLRHAVHIAAPIRPPPRANRARMSATARVQGRSHAPGRWVSKGRAEVSLSLPSTAKRAIARKGDGGSWFRTRKSWPWLQGARKPFARWVQGERQSPWSGCNTEMLHSAGAGSMPASIHAPG